MKALIEPASQHHCTIFSNLYAAGLLSTNADRHTNASNRLGRTSWFIAVNLCHNNILRKEYDVPSAPGWNTLIPRNLACFVDSEHKPAPGDVCILTFELNEQMKEPQDELPRLAHRGGRDTTSCGSCETTCFTSSSC